MVLWYFVFLYLGVEEVDCFEFVELFEWIREGCLVEVYNVWFEWGIWINVCVLCMGWFVVGYE